MKTSNIDINVDLHDFQMDFLNCQKPDQLFAGGSGIGKTFAASLKIVKYMLEYPGSQAMCASYRWLDTQNVVEENILSWLSGLPKGSYTQEKVKKKIVFDNGSIIRFMNLEKAGSLKSYNIDIIWIEEGIEVENPEDIYEQLQNRLRSSYPEYPKQFIVTTNPGLKSHYLYKKFYVNNTPNQWAVTLPASAGKHLDEAYLNRLKNLSPDRREMLYEGKWGVIAGSAVKLGKSHIKDFQEVRNEWKYYLTYDYGFAPDPGVWLLVGLYKNTIYIINELEFFETPAIDQYEDLIKMIDGRKLYYYTGDVSAGSGEYRKMLERNTNMYFMPPRKNRYAGWRKLIDSFNGKDDYEIVISPRCKRTIDSIESLVWMPNKMDLQSVNGDDHFADSLRYFLTSEIASRKSFNKKIKIAKKNYRNYYTLPKL